MGELKKLNIKPPSRNTVKNILTANGHDPGPQSAKGSWAEFLTMHAETLYQCDFFSKRIWTPTGLRQYFVPAFLSTSSSCCRRLDRTIELCGRDCIPLGCSSTQHCCIRSNTLFGERHATICHASSRDEVRKH